MAAQNFTEEAHNPTPSAELSALFTTRRRVIIACTNCRKRKIRCMTSEESPVNPCERCEEKGLRCEYVTITDQRRQKRTRTRARGLSSATAKTGSPSPRDDREFEAHTPSPTWSLPNASPYMHAHDIPLPSLAQSHTDAGPSDQFAFHYPAEHSTVYPSGMVAARLSGNLDLDFESTSVPIASSSRHSPTALPLPHHQTSLPLSRSHSPYGPLPRRNTAPAFLAA
ncbi:C6 finger domain [Mycena chlorophos]|uniref:C6 finger domain n=1 Tax=Mycena chlorophos TaxID=658473 RepID=A0A8H6TK92_MYCCL|nr:C6 finger domain [Mycena chlorophos]